ncbi:MAG: exopolysaccharide biosynthesis polyprenyl glycosylphosphotransferase [Bacteroidetes bacterium]|nr:exopolysaccharide biosynthesis polyprenyl glycosylphosphotransferase [Bacteroidota bacterium]
MNLAIAISYRWLGSDHRSLVDLIYLLIFSNLSWLFLIVVSNPYGFRRGWGASKYIKNQISYVVVHLIVVAFLILFFKRSYTFMQIVGIYGVFVPLFFGWKILALYIVTLFTEGKVKEQNMIILGRQEEALEVRRHFLLHKELNYKFLQRFELTHEEQLNEIASFCREKDVHAIFCCPGEINNDVFRKLIEFGLNHFIQVKVISQVQSTNQNDFALEKEDSVGIRDQSIVPLDEYRNQLLKRSFDLAFSSLVIILVLSWLLPLIGILIKLDSRGPVFFRQKRGGLKNRPFNCLKFRTMVINSEADVKQATKDDPRITRLGSFLRKSSLDEFPQFLNVFMGDMSLIGPRPHPLRLNEEFSEKIERLMSRHYVKPGLTGLAQSMGFRGETKNVIDMENRIAMDIFYIENWSLWLDIKIVIRTVISLVKGSENAY